MDVRVLDGRGYAKFVVAGTYFLKKYRGVLNDLNVYFAGKTNFKPAVGCVAAVWPRSRPPLRRAA